MVDWLENVQHNRALVRQNAGPRVVTVVTANQRDQNYWCKHFQMMSRDLFRSDAETLILSVAEGVKKGNFLGTINAWKEIRSQGVIRAGNERDVALINMVFGEGKRLSPFTQALGNRKTAFLTPLKSQHGDAFLNVADLSSLYTNLWVHTLRESGFLGAVVKWGDEAVIPGLRWPLDGKRFGQYDAVRFVWKRELTDDLAREKEWVAIDPGRGQVIHQFSRQPVGMLRERIAEFSTKGMQIAVNLGSLAISYEFLDLALDILAVDLQDPQKWVDWDPYVWMALHCENEQQWEKERQHEQRIGKTGIADLETRYPDFYARLVCLRRALEQKTGRCFSVGMLEFGEPFWVDFGLHLPLRSTLEALLADTERGAVAREVFDISSVCDQKGNVIIRSSVPPAADIQNSMIIDSVIDDEHSVVRHGLIVGGLHQKLFMPEGGSALFCAIKRLAMTGPHAIAFWALGDTLQLREGDRCTTMLVPTGVETMFGNENIIDYSGENYTQPILGNRYSFEGISKLMLGVDGQELEARWTELLRAHARS